MDAKTAVYLVWTPLGLHQVTLRNGLVISFKGPVIGVKPTYEVADNTTADTSPNKDETSAELRSGLNSPPPLYE